MPHTSKKVDCLTTKRKTKSVRPRPSHRTRLGRYYVADALRLLEGPIGTRLKGRVQLLFTSPPYPLNRKKAYGNLTGSQYRDWFESLAPLFTELLAPNGSIVIELGNAWVPGRPIQSLLHLESLIKFVEHPTAKLRLCQQFICYNPSRLPTPAAWVTVGHHRVTDSFTHVWWIAKTDFPKADNRRIRRPYSAAMRRLLERGSYNNGSRPSEHRISKSAFATDRKGSLAHNVIEMEQIDPARVVRLPNVVSFANTVSNDFFFRKCRSGGVTPHPARMPPGLAAFFIQFLTRPGDLVLDPFAGSNTTGFVAELLQRKWIAIDRDRAYVRQSRIRFGDPSLRDHSYR